jgi:diamine N-acetyltransferase
MEVVIRRAEQSDYQALAELYREVHNFHAEIRPDIYRLNASVLSEQDFHQKIASGSETFLVAEVCGQITGFAHVMFKERPPLFSVLKSADITALAVTQCMRSQGIGKALLVATETWASAKGAAYLTIGANAFNPRAQLLYENSGFKVESVKLGKFIEPN